LPVIRDQGYRLLRDAKARTAVCGAENVGVVLYLGPTWGFYVFITDYTPIITEKIPQAIEKLLKVTQ
jgi:hypothetical protein